MKKRDPFRFRKSEIQRRRSSPGPAGPSGGRGGHGPGLPRPETARQLAFSILDEHRETRAFVGQLLDERLEGQHRGFLSRPPLKGRVGSRSVTPGTEPVRRPVVSPLSRMDRRLVSELVNGVVRREATLDAVLRHYIERPRFRMEPPLWTLLQLGVYQLVLMPGLPPHAAVDETVQLAHWLREPRWTSFLNGVLRSIARDVTDDFTDAPGEDTVPVELRPRRAAVALDAVQDEGSAVDNEPDVPLPTTGPYSKFRVPVMTAGIRYRRLGKSVFPSPDADLPGWIAQAFGLPAWLVHRWSRRMSGSELLDLAAWLERRQPMTLRVNPLKGTRNELLARFAATEGLSAPGVVQPGNRPESILYDGPVRVIDLPGFSDGFFTVQDETAMSAGALLAPEPGQLVLDLCAAPGTKSTHLAELMRNEGRIIAADVEPRRLPRIEENAQRLELTIIEPLRIRRNLENLPEGPFDAVLIDAPCSNTGVSGKRPEVRTRLAPTDLEELSGIQSRLMEAAVPLVKVGGRLVYSTCSIEPEENTDIVQQFMARHPDWKLAQELTFLPGRPSDGGYQALLIRSR